MSDEQRLRIDYMKLAELVEFPGNPKAHDLEELGGSARRYGFNDPVAVNERTGHLLEGHGRREWLLAERAAGAPPPLHVVVDADGEWLIPVVRGVSFETDEAAEEYLLAHNEVGRRAGYKNEPLAEMLRRIQSRRVSPSSLGFGRRQVLQTLAESRKLRAQRDDVDFVPEAPKKPRSKLGDVFELGQHLLLCGDCEGLGGLIAPASVRLMITDPPYGVKYESAGKRFKREVTTPIENDALEDAELERFFQRSFGAARPLLQPGACFYVTGPQGGNMILLLLALRQAGMQPRHELVWVKSQLVFGRSDYHYQHEPIMYGWVEGAAHKAVEDRTETSTWHMPKPRSSELHPTMKPVELYERAMRNSSDAGDLVLDLFAGSGTAFIAAERLGRRCVASEISPAYCDVIVDRWERLTGGKARRR